MLPLRLIYSSALLLHISYALSPAHQPLERDFLQHTDFFGVQSRGYRLSGLEENAASILHPFNSSSLRRLQSRQTSCVSGTQPCGSGCIFDNDSCCAAYSSGCPPGYYCDMGGCCPNGETCTGSTGDCPGDSKTCGNTCIIPSSTCCPDGTGGCPTGSYCGLGSDGRYGCCENGKICTGSVGGGSGGGGSGCDSDEVICGDSCIPSTDTCCPDQQGGCPVGSYCDIGGDGIYSCCRDGRTCTDGSGGAGATPTGSGTSITGGGGGSITTTSVDSGGGGGGGGVVTTTSQQPPATTMSQQSPTITSTTTTTTRRTTTDQPETTTASSTIVSNAGVGLSAVQAVQYLFLPILALTWIIPMYD